MTDAELSALEAAAKAATPGPWRHPGRALVVSRMSEDEPLVCDCISEQFAQAPKNAAFIAAANPAAILELIAEMRQTRRERDWLARQLDFENCCVPSDLKEEPGYCLEHECVECGLSSANAWLDAAKEATCQK